MRKKISIGDYFILWQDLKAIVDKLLEINNPDTIYNAWYETLCFFSFFKKCLFKSFKSAF